MAIDIDFSKTEIVFDIGAYDGGKAQVIADAGVDRLICVEPNPHSYYKLTRRFINNPSVTLLNRIVCDEVKEDQPFHISRAHPPISTANARFMKESRFTDKADENNIPFKWDEEVKVDTTTIDTLIDEYGEPDFIKIDVEGNEYAVLKGLTRLIKTATICFEFNEEFLDEAESCLGHGVSLGYNQFGLIEGDNIDQFPKKYHTSNEFLNRISTGFPSPTKDFFGMMFMRYSDE